MKKENIDFLFDYLLDLGVEKSMIHSKDVTVIDSLLLEEPEVVMQLINHYSIELENGDISSSSFIPFIFAWSFYCGVGAAKLGLNCEKHDVSIVDYLAGFEDYDTIDETVYRLFSDDAFLRVHKIIDTHLHYAVLKCIEFANRTILNNNIPSYEDDFQEFLSALFCAAFRYGTVFDIEYVLNRSNKKNLPNPDEIRHELYEDMPKVFRVSGYYKCTRLEKPIIYNWIIEQCNDKRMNDPRLRGIKSDVSIGQYLFLLGSYAFGVGYNLAYMENSLQKPVESFSEDETDMFLREMDKEEPYLIRLRRLGTVDIPSNKRESDTVVATVGNYMEHKLGGYSRNDEYAKPFMETLFYAGFTVARYY